MPHPTINRQDSIEIFHQLMQPDSQFRVLRLVGEAKMGKSHLVTKVFPALARDTYGARCAVLDLRNRTQNSLDILHAACGQIGDDTSFSIYTAEYREWMNRPKVAVKGFLAVLTSVSILAQDEASETSKAVRGLTSHFVADLRNLGNGLVLLLFDQVDDANDETRSWLVDGLLVQLASLPQLRTVLAGQDLPEARGAYAAVCKSHNLPPVEEPKAYIAYCHDVGAELDEQSICDIAKLLDHRPGLFVDLVLPKFGRQGV